MSNCALRGAPQSRLIPARAKVHTRVGGGAALLSGPMGLQHTQARSLRVGASSVDGRSKPAALTALLRNAPAPTAQTSQLANLLQNVPKVFGSLPSGSAPTALVVTRLSDLNTFSEFFAAVFHEANRLRMPQVRRTN